MYYTCGRPIHLSENSLFTYVLNRADLHFSCNNDASVKQRISYKTETFKAKHIDLFNFFKVSPLTIMEAYLNLASSNS